jgi:hypothetical protein
LIETSFNPIPLFDQEVRGCAMLGAAAQKLMT